MASKCAGCFATLNAKKMLRCTSCPDKYDEQCAGTTLKDLKMTQISAWECPKCCNMRPKKDNSNTPVRRDNEALNNVITTRKQSTATSDQSGLSLSRDEITDIVRQEIRSAIKDCMKDAIRTCIEEQYKDIRAKIDELEASVTFIGNQYEDITRDIKKAQSLPEEHAKLKSTVFELSNRLNQMEQLTRASNVELQCVPERAGENLLQVVMQLGTTINHPVPQTEILQCNRIAKANPLNPRPRSILVKFASPRTRDIFLAATRKFNKEHNSDKLNTSHLGISVENKQNIYVAEHLPKETKALHTAVRLRAKEFGYKIVWVKHGRVYVRRSEGDQHMWVKDMDALKNIK